MWKTVYFADGITVNFDALSKNGTIDSEELMGAFDDTDPWACGMHGISSLILACACAGVDIDSPWFHEAVGTAVEAVTNELGE